MQPNSHSIARSDLIPLSPQYAACNWQEMPAARGFISREEFRPYVQPVMWPSPPGGHPRAASAADHCVRMAALHTERRLGLLGRWPIAGFVGLIDGGKAHLGHDLV